MGDIDLQQILEMLEKGLRYSDIVRETGLSYGQIRYRLKKFGVNPKQTLDDMNSGVDAEETMEQSFDQVVDLPIVRTMDESWTRDRLVSGIYALVKDPETLFVYWFIKADRRSWVEQFFNCGWRDMPVYLRVYDVTDLYFNGYNAHKMWEIAVNHDADSWYIHSLESGRSYVVDFGIHTLQNEFLTLLRSNCVSTPHVSFSRYQQPSLRFQAIHTS